MTGSAVRRTTGMVTVITTLIALAGCTGPDDKSAPKPSPTPTLTRSVDLSGLPVARAPFCDMIDPDSVEGALGGPVASTDHYESGEEAEITPGFTDVAHEYSCSFTGSPTSAARAWVFAPPVPTEQARRLVEEAERAEGCTAMESVQYGTPSSSTACVADEPAPVIRARMQGLFGDAWLSCELTTGRDAEQPLGPQRDEAAERAERWCVDLVTTIGARP